jgi:hypothetical protein
MFQIIRTLAGRFGLWSSSADLRLKFRIRIGRRGLLHLIEAALVPQRNRADPGHVFMTCR